MKKLNNNITIFSANCSMNSCCEVNSLNLAKKLTPPLKFLTYNSFNQTDFEELTNYNSNFKSKSFNRYK